MKENRRLIWAEGRGLGVISRVWWGEDDIRKDEVFKDEVFKDEVGKTRRKASNLA